MQVKISNDTYLQYLTLTRHIFCLIKCDAISDRVAEGKLSFDRGDYYWSKMQINQDYNVISDDHDIQY